ncbi:hypothetical protein K461DRAFT_289870 [Myriangium duriaei CBS 260.36]|uniref:Galactose oxidase n=1 Tax=Myriangium duriaei CBS 260.36 TaxID=1168546 RepID=A0A9P4J9X0_9PEZI|nr:hypothetical protein K461DRAFT_289870 [Myriangium duriaei CBS 260.36]
MAEAAGVFYAAETLVEGAVAAIKGIYDPTLPLKVNITPVKDISLPRHSHTVSIVKGRAYIFGGVTTDTNGSEAIADNNIHVVILPVSNIEGSDYKVIPAYENAPAPRFGHSAAVIEDQIYIYGGSSDLSTASPLDESGAVWVFDTRSSQWTKLAAAKDVAPPPARLGHAAVATPHPRKPFRRTDEGLMPQVDADPARPDLLPEPEKATEFGTLIVQGGRLGSGEAVEASNDLWAFDIAARAWSPLPSPSQLTRSTPSASLAIVKSRLYTLVAGHVQSMDLVAQTYDDKGGSGSLGITALSPWAPLERSSSSSGPGERTGAALEVVTTGQGRNYLLLVGGESSAEHRGDIWTLQLQPEGSTAASIKDAARMAIGKGTGEKEWAEVRYFDGEGVMIQEGQAGRGIGARKGFAWSKDAEEDGGTVFVQGGLEGGKISGDGILITVSI